MVVCERKRQRQTFLSSASTFWVFGCARSSSHLALLACATRSSRLERVLEQLESIKSREKITKHEAQSVQGLLNFMSGFVMGSSLRVACRAFANLTSDVRVRQQDVRRAVRLDLKDRQVPSTSRSAAEE